MISEAKEMRVRRNIYYNNIMRWEEAEALLSTTPTIKGVLFVIAKREGGA